MSIIPSDRTRILRLALITEPTRCKDEPLTPEPIISSKLPANGGSIRISPIHPQPDTNEAILGQPPISVTILVPGIILPPLRIVLLSQPSDISTNGLLPCLEPLRTTIRLHVPNESVRVVGVSRPKRISRLPPVPTGQIRRVIILGPELPLDGHDHT